jgi:SAM-dependent methyltransferase
MIEEPTVNRQNGGVTRLEHRLEGHLDSVDSSRAQGWAWDRERPNDPVHVDLLVDGQLAATVLADVYGADLELGGIGNGHHRWSLSTTEYLGDGAMHLIAVRHHGTDLHLAQSPRRVGGELLDTVSHLDPKELLAHLHLRGSGLEIGALHRPQVVPTHCTVRYVDRLNTAQLRAEYPELGQYELVDVDIVDDGETLASIATESEDFVIANHFLEHCEDPIGTLANLTRVLRVGGVLQLTIPNKRGTSDAPRPAVTMQHLAADHRDAGRGSRHEHYVEWVQHVEQVTDPTRRAARVAELEAKAESIHFHAFTELEVAELVAVAHRNHGVPVELTHLARNDDQEITVVLRKRSAKPQHVS